MNFAQYGAVKSPMLPAEYTTFWFNRVLLVDFNSLTDLYVPIPSCLFQWLQPVIPVAADQHWSMDSLPVYCSGGHRRQFSGVLHHSIHRRGLCCAHLHHLYLWGSGEALSSGGNLPCQHVQQLGQPHHVFVSAEMFCYLMALLFLFLNMIHILILQIYLLTLWLVMICLGFIIIYNWYSLLFYSTVHGLK